MTAETAAAHRAIEAVWRLESARIIAGLTGLLRDVGLAEELAQDALVAALEQWPADGIPANPGGLAHADRPAPGHRPDPAERTAEWAKLNLLGHRWKPRRMAPRPSSTTSWTRAGSTTICCG